MCMVGTHDSSLTVLTSLLFGASLHILSVFEINDEGKIAQVCAYHDLDQPER